MKKNKNEKKKKVKNEKWKIMKGKQNHSYFSYKEFNNSLGFLTSSLKEENEGNIFWYFMKFSFSFIFTNKVSQFKRFLIPSS